jgi:CRISPR/Cas system-associated endonuclease Cas1
MPQARARLGKVARSDRRTRSPRPTLNYLYAILETETTIALERMGLDPTLGLMRSEKRYRPALASGVMESVRRVPDRIAIDLLTDHELGRGEGFETRKGVCRLGPPMARALGGFSEELREAVAPHAERLVRSVEGAWSSDAVDPGAASGGCGPWSGAVRETLHEVIPSGPVLPDATPKKGALS